MFAMSVSLDGFFEGPDHDLGWHMISHELHAHFNEHLGAMSAFLGGRVTYELMAGYWPTADQDPASTPTEVEFARIWREMPKIVFSRTLEHADWNTAIARSVDPQEIARLKDQPGGDMAIGGADLAASFMRLGLVDELYLYVHPIVLGQGTPLFKPLDAPAEFAFVATRPFDNGVVLLRYERR